MWRFGNSDLPNLKCSVEKQPGLNVTDRQDPASSTLRNQRGALTNNFKMRLWEYKYLSTYSRLRMEGDVERKYNSSANFFDQMGIPASQLHLILTHTSCIYCVNMYICVCMSLFKHKAQEDSSIQVVRSVRIIF